MKLTRTRVKAPRPLLFFSAKGVISGNATDAEKAKLQEEREIPELVPSFERLNLPKSNVPLPFLFLHYVKKKSLLMFQSIV